VGSRYRGKEEEVRALSALINLSRASDSLVAAHARRLAKDGLTLRQFGVLETLYHLGPMMQSEIGKKLLKTSGDMTMVVKNLEKQGLVRRRRSAEDRRCVAVHLTAKGTRLVERVLPGHVAGIVEDFARLTPEEQVELRRLCRTLGIRREELT